MRSSILLALSAASLAAATNYTVDPTAIDASTRSSWCAGQVNTCSTLCDDNPKTDSCDTTDLTYSCTCSNGSAPGLEYYTQTMPTYLCQQEYADCILANPNNATGQEECKTDIEDTCGTLDPTNYTAAATTTSSSASSSATATSSVASASATVASATSTAGAMATKMAHYGNGAAAVAVGVFAYLL